MSDTTAYNEADLLSSISRGDERAFSLLIGVYSAKVYAHVLTYIKSAFLAEEITQDIFLKIWEVRSELVTRTNFAGYLYVITRNRTISELRKRLPDPADNLVVTVKTTDNPLEQLEYRQLSDIILNAIEKLPPRRRQIFKMSRFEGLTYDKIGEELNISRGTVNEHIVESLLFLRTYLRGRIDHTLILLCGAWLLGFPQ